MHDLELNQLAVRFYKLGAVKFGEFKLKSGIISPVYVDLRVLISYPEILSQVSKIMARLLDCNMKIDLVCGVPYGALPIATCLSVDERIPMIMCRKEAKSYGSKQMIEGCWKAGQQCIIVEDVITSGSSVVSVVELLRQSDILVEHVAVLVDRDQGGAELLKMNHGIQVHSIFKLTGLMDILLSENYISPEQVHEVRKFLKNSNFLTKSSQIPPELTFSCSQIERLNRIMETKSTRLCVAVDLVKPDDILDIVDRLGPKLCAVKLHMDIIKMDSCSDRINSITHHLRDLANRHGFLIIEDRKLADIGHTVYLQLINGVFKLAEWCDLVTVHCLSGPGVFEAFRKVNKNLSSNGIKRELAALVVTEMSSTGSLTKDRYLDQCAEMIKQNRDVIGGIVSQGPLSGLDSNVPYWVPGIKLSAGTDQLGQNYNTPDLVLAKFGSRASSVIMVVGRGITESPDPVEVAETYRRLSIAKLN